MNRCRRTVRRIACAALVAALGLVSVIARGEEDRPAILTLIVNHAARGEATVVLRGKDVWVATEDLIKARLTWTAGGEETFFDKRYVSLASVRPRLRFTVDEVALTLAVEAETSMLPTSIVDFRPGAPPALVFRKDTSAFLNYDARLSDFKQPSAYAETGVSVEGALIYSAAQASMTGGVVRAQSNVTVDDKDRLQRWVAGDTFISGGVLGGGLFTAGLTITRSFDLDPYFIHQPSLGFSGAAPAPSTLDVYVNGVLVRSEALDPGPFEIKNLPVATGAGAVSYVVRDAFGHQESVSSPYYMSAGLLTKGLHEYTYSLGFARVNPSTQSFHYAALGLLGHDRYGITDKITIGGRVEATRQLVSAGPTITVLLPAGTLELAVAGSVAAAGKGGAGFASYSYASKGFGASLAVTGTSEAYSTLSLAPTDDRVTLALQSSTWVPLGKRATFGAQQTVSIDRDTGALVRVGLSSTIELMRGLHLAISADRTRMPNDTKPIDAFVSATYMFGKVSVSAGASAEAGAYEGFVEVDKPLPRGEGYGYRATVEAGTATDIQAVGQYQGAYGRYEVSAQAGSTGEHMSLDAAGAIVLVRGAGIFATRPVQDGFAVVRIPGVRGVRGYLDNQEVGRTDRNGNLVLPELLPYYGNRLAICDTDLPLGFDIGKTEQVIAPPLRGAALVVFDAKPARFQRGTVRVRAKGKLTIPAYGDIEVRTGETTQSSPISAEGDFELEGVPAGVYKATVRDGHGAATCEVHVPASTQMVADLGRVECTR